MTLVFRDMVKPAARVWEELSKAVIGKEEVKFLLLVALICRGHVLIEGLPGSGKTTLAKSFAKIIGGDFKRIQFTPDMLPSDVTGFYIHNPQGGSHFVPGPIFANVVLADELNRTTPRTQSGLLEAMQEQQVTIEGVTHPLPRPFMVIASQIPHGAQGTYPLTEVQSDRFMFRAGSQYPPREVEEQVIKNIDYLDEPNLASVIDPEEIKGLQEDAKKVHVSQGVADYILDLVNATRRDRDVFIGPSPRASISLYKGARAAALLQMRDFVLPDDVKELAPAVLGHRIFVKPEAQMEDITPDLVISKALQEVPVPKD